MIPVEVNPAEVYADCCKSILLNLEEIPYGCSFITGVASHYLSGRGIAVAPMAHPTMPSCFEVNGPKTFWRASTEDLSDD